VRGAGRYTPFAVTKGDTDEADIRHAESIKKLFVAARKGDRLKIVKLADFDPSETEENTDG